MRPASDASEHHSRVVTSSFVHERPNMAIWQLLWQPQRCHNITLGARPMGYFEELTYHTLLSPFDLVSSDLIWSRNFGLVIVRLGLLRLNVWVWEWEWSMDRGYVAPVRTRWGSRLGRVDGGFILRVGRLTCIPTDLFFFQISFPRILFAMGGICLEASIFMGFGGCFCLFFSDSYILIRCLIFWRIGTLSNSLFGITVMLVPQNHICRWLKDVCFIILARNWTRLFEMPQIIHWGEHDASWDIVVLLKQCGWRSEEEEERYRERFVFKLTLQTQFCIFQ